MCKRVLVAVFKQCAWPFRSASTLSNLVCEYRPRLGDTTEANTNVLSQNLFFRCGSTTNAYTENHYMCEMGPLPKYGHI